jgi:hypothetical protein
MKRMRVLASLLAISVAAVLTVMIASPASAGASGGPVPIVNTGDGLCLQPESIGQGAKIIQRTCNDTAIQAWDYWSLGGNAYQFYNIGSGFCLDAQGGATNGTPIIQWTCNGISNEKWDTRGGLPDITALTSLVSGTHTHCLDVPQAAPTLDLPMQLFRCNGTGAQGWMIGIGIIIQP